MHNSKLGYIFYKQKRDIRLLNHSQRNILNRHLLMAGMGEAYKLIRLKQHKEEFLYSVIYGLNKDIISLKNEASLYKIAFEKRRYIWILKLEKPEESSGDKI